MSIQPVAIWHDGETVPYVKGPIWPYTTAAVPDGEMWSCIHKGKRRRVAPIRRWAAHEPTWHYERGDRIARDILRLFDQLHIGAPRPLLPSSLAFRVFRHHLPAGTGLPFFPDEMGAWAVQWSPVYTIRPPHPCPRFEPYIEVWDMNCAYGAAVDIFPEMIRGRDRFRHRRGYHGPWGMYKMQGDRPAMPGTYLESRPDLQTQVERGWVLEKKIDRGISLEDSKSSGRRLAVFGADRDGDGDAPSSRDSHRRKVRPALVPGFVPLCFTWPGIAKKLMRRLPALAVGKTMQHRGDEDSWEGTGYCYPPLWAWTTGWLRARMEAIFALYQEACVHAYVDAVHLRCPMYVGVGKALGQWKLIARGEGRYLDLNTYVIEGEDAKGRPKTYFKHQSIAAGSTAKARVIFEKLWEAAA